MLGFVFIDPELNLTIYYNKSDDVPENEIMQATFKENLRKIKNKQIIKKNGEIRRLIGQLLFFPNLVLALIWSTIL